MTFALDAAGHPDPQQCKDSGALFVGQYVGTRYQNFGTTRAYIDSCLGIGLGVLLIFEEWASQFLGGYDDGRAMMDRMHMGWDKLGAPNDGTVIPAIALVDPNPGAVPGHEQALIGFARGINDELWLSEFTGYGSKYGLDVVRDSGVAPKLTRRWGVGTWGFGESPSGALPANTDADMIQHGNIGSPVTGTDYNTVFRADMGQWGDTDVNEDQNKWLQAIYQRTGGDGQASRGVLDDVIAGKALQGYISNLALLDVLNEIKALLAAGGQGGDVNVALLPTDIKAIAKAVNDDAAARLKE